MREYHRTLTDVSDEAVKLCGLLYNMSIDDSDWREMVIIRMIRHHMAKVMYGLNELERIQDNGKNKSS